MPKGNSGKKVQTNSQTYYNITDALDRISIYNMPDFLQDTKMSEEEIRKAIIEHKFGIYETDIDGRFDVTANSKYADIINKINKIDASSSERGGRLTQNYVSDKVHSFIDGMDGRQLRELGQELGFSRITSWKTKEQRKNMIAWYVSDRFVTNYGNSEIRDKTLAQPSFRIDNVVHDVKNRFSHTELGRERLAKVISGLSQKEIKAYGKELSWNKENHEKYLREIKRLSK